MAKPTAQVRRIQEMSQRLEHAAGALRSFETALGALREAQEDIAVLETYYTSRLWRKDFEDDEAGKVPRDIDRGVLSEDAVYDLLTDNRRLHTVMLDAVKAYVDPDGE